MSKVKESETLRLPDADGTMQIMGGYTWTIGEDEEGHYIAYYDKWDLDLPVEQTGFFGKPFELYDRLYYDPETYMPLNVVMEKLATK